MNWDRIEGSWDQMKAKVKEKWGKLTDDDIKVIGGKKDRLLGKLQERYGRARDTFEGEVDSWINDLDDTSTRH